MWLAALLGGVALSSAAASPEVIAHRGASGYLPEHTLPAYALAYGQGAAWIEPDVVMTRDGVLVALHDTTLESTTDVAARFSARARADGRYYVADFDSSEIDALRVKERVPARFPQEPAIFRVPSFDDVLTTLVGLNRSTGCQVGVFPEIKDSAAHHASGLDPERALLAALARHGLESSPLVRIQSFEPASLERLRGYGSRHHLVQLIADDPARAPPIELAAIARYANAIGPAKTLLVRDPTLVARAHALELDVVAWTFRADQVAKGFASFDAELDWATALGIDALFTDHPDRAVARLGATRRCRGV
jgi:glycerophosphoryl diester phosphodiesterase